MCSIVSDKANMPRVKMLALFKSWSLWLKFKMLLNLYSSQLLWFFFFLPVRSKPFKKNKSLTQFFSLFPCIGLGVKVVVWLYSLTTAEFLTLQIPPGLTNVNKDPEKHQREVSSELKPHCIGSLWCPAVRKDLFCSTTRSISESQGDGGDQPWDF